jgi:hypothetical protein
MYDLIFVLVLLVDNAVQCSMLPEKHKGADLQ